MLKGLKIGFLGSGNIARALISGLLRGKHTGKAQLSSSDVHEEKAKEIAKEFGIFTSTKNSEIVERSDVLVLCVKPQIMSRVLNEISPSVTANQLIISVAAGIPISSIENSLTDGCHVVRVMPNMPVLVDCGMSALATGAHASAKDLKIAQAILGAVGETVVLDEEQMDAVTGLSGSGPAYIFMIVDALADAGVKVGLSRDVALKLATQTVLGSAKLLIESGEHPSRLKDRVTSPGGTAIAGIHTLEEGGLRTTLINAVERATARSKTLGREYSGKRRKTD